MQGLTTTEERLFRKLNTPARIQDFLDKLPINHEKKGETCYSPRMVLRTKKAHCLEGALLAAAILAYHGYPSLLMHFATTPEDEDHAVALFRVNGLWGAISKTNHPMLRYRDPIYRTPRELALSYFHEYFMLENGKKTLRGYSKPFSLARFGSAWITREDNLWDIADMLTDTPHLPLVPKSQLRKLRPATPFERKGFAPVEWPKSDPRT